MTKLLTTLSILLIATASYAQTYTVERVIDGDTLKLTNGEEVSPWTEKVDKIHQGMDRGDVKKLLPPTDRCEKIIVGQGGSQVVSYWLDDKWKVSIAYDYEGIPRNKDGSALNNYSPNNKVLSKPTLKREDCKVITIDFAQTYTVERVVDGDTIQLTIKSDKQVYEVGEEIVIGVSFKNISNETIRILLYDEPSNNWLVFSYFKVLVHPLVIDEEQKISPFNLEEIYGRTELPWVGRYLKPQESISFDVPLTEKLNSLYPDFNFRPNQYNISIKYQPDEHASHVGYWTGTLTSNTITIELMEKKVETYTVSEVIDGDTLKLTNGEEVQLIGIKAHEDDILIKGATATTVTKNIVGGLGAKVTLEFDVQKKDKNGKLLAYVTVPWRGGAMPKVDNVVVKQDDTGIWIFLNAYIIKLGYATPMPPHLM